MKHKLIAMTLLAAALFSCGKEDKNNSASERTTLLTQQAWLFESAAFRPAGSSLNLNIGSQLAPCLTDNSISFNTNGSGTVAEGASTCNTSDPATTPFTWRFVNNETEIGLTGNVIPGVSNGQFKLETLSTTQLSVSKDTSYMGFSGTLVANFKH